MPGKHKDFTMTFRPSAWERAIIEQRVTLSGMHKKDFIARSCTYSKIIIVGKKENVQRIVDALQEMQIVMEEIAGQVRSGGFSLSDESYAELKRDYLALVVTVVDIVNEAAYLFEKEAQEEQKSWKAKLELEQYRNILELEEDNRNQKEKRDTD